MTENNSKHNKSVLMKDLELIESTNNIQINSAASFVRQCVAASVCCEKKRESLGMYRKSLMIETGKPIMFTKNQRQRYQNILHLQIEIQ